MNAEEDAFCSLEVYAYVSDIVSQFFSMATGTGARNGGMVLFATAQIVESVHAVFRQVSLNV